MTGDLLECVARSHAAERAGDAAEALEWHQAVPMFQRGRHRAVLDRLARLGDELPPWVWARWIVYQVTRCEDSTSATGQLQHTVLSYALESVHADQLADCHADGGDPIKVVAWVASESWFFHQLFVHESGGLATFLDEFPTGRLAEHAELARAWVGRRMSGYQVGASLPGGRLRVYDAGAASWLEVLDLGARSSAGDEGWVLGRLVPSGVDDLLMFDVPPLAVAERIAREVAEAGERPWAPVTAALAEGRLVQTQFMREDYELATDVQELDLLRFGTPARDYERVMEQLRDGRDEVGRAAYRILQRALDGSIAQRDAAYVGAAALNPHADTEVRSRLLRGGQYDTWSRWAALVPEPARSRLLDYARVTRAAG
jgi:hypothetical protein